MSEEWATWIIGRKFKSGKTWRSQISFCYYTVSQAVTFLATDPEYRNGVACLSYRKRKQIAGLGKTASYVSLQEIVDGARLSTFKGVDDTDLLFVPCKKRAFPKTRSGKMLGEWAHANNLPDINVHDNDHVWFCGFPLRTEKPIFIEFLKASVFDIGHLNPRISRDDWSLIRQGLFDHGYTLNRSLCSYKKGIITYVLWAGIPDVSLIRANPKKPLCSVPQKLTLALQPDDALTVQQSKGKCPLKSNYGDLDGLPPKLR